MKKNEFYGRRLVIALFFADLFLVGLPYYSVINTYMLRDLHMSRTLYGLGFTLTNLFYGLPSTLVAIVILRWGLKATFGTGAALIVVGALWLAFFVSRPWEYLLSFGVLIGTGLAFSTNISIGTTITRWFRRYRGRAMAFVFSGAAIGGLLGTTLVNRLLTANGGDWRQAWIIMAALAFLGGAVAVWYVKECPEDLGQVPDGTLADSAAGNLATQHNLTTPHVWTPSQAYRTLPFWAIVIGGVACKYPLFFMLGHWVLHLRGAGLNAAVAATALGIFTVTQIAGQFVGGWLVDKIKARYALVLGFSCYLIGVYLALRVSAHAILTADAASVLFGVGFGWTFVAVYTLVGHFYGPAAYPKLSGVLALLSSTIAAPASAISGKLYDVYGGYTQALELIAVISLVGIVAGGFATMPRPRQTITS
jgi:MFS family permease